MISKFLDWIVSFFITGRTIRVNPDHLPGLRPPKPMPFRPKLEQKQVEAESIYDTYERFRKSRTSNKTNRRADWKF
jgi:hypothetical protein